MENSKIVLVAIKERLLLRETVTMLDDRGIETVIAESFLGVLWGLEKYPIFAIVFSPYLEFDLNAALIWLCKLQLRRFLGLVVAVNARPEDKKILCDAGVQFEVTGDCMKELLGMFGVGYENKKEVTDGQGA